MIKVTLSGNVPIGIEYVKAGTVAGVNEVIYADNVPPADFYMNFHTYIVVAGSLVRNAGIPIDNRIIGWDEPSAFEPVIYIASKLSIDQME